MTYSNILFQTDGKIARLTVNRPEKLNALNTLTLEEIASAVTMVSADATLGALIVTGSGEKAFVAGADIRELSGLDAAGGKSFSERGQRVLDLIAASPKPVIAAVNGFALGGGCELALACHIRICSSNARFGQPEVNLGLIPGAGGSQRLPRIVGRAHAAYLILTGDQIKADEALRMGLVSQVVDPANLIPTAEKIATTILSKGPVAIRYALEAIRRGTEMPMNEALGLEAALFGLCFATEDMKEGTLAFLEKRSPSFEGR